MCNYNRSYRSGASSDTYQYDYEFTAGNTEYINLIIKDDKGVVVPVSTIHVQLREDITDVTEVLTVVGSFEEDTGISVAKFTAEETQSLLLPSEEEKEYIYSFKVVFDNGDTYTPIKGKIKVFQSITKI